MTRTHSAPTTHKHTLQAAVALDWRTRPVRHECAPSQEQHTPHRCPADAYSDCMYMCVCVSQAQLQVEMVAPAAVHILSHTHRIRCVCVCACVCCVCTASHLLSQVVLCVQHQCADVFVLMCACQHYTHFTVHTYTHTHAHTHTQTHAPVVPGSTLCPASIVRYSQSALQGDRLCQPTRDLCLLWCVGLRRGSWLRWQGWRQLHLYDAHTHTHTHTRLHTRRHTTTLAYHTQAPRGAAAVQRHISQLPSVWRCMCVRVCICV